MKPKSNKLRLLLTLRTLFKYTDEDHRLNTTGLNEHLRPYGLECTRAVIQDSVSALQDFGLTIKRKGTWTNNGIWIENRPLNPQQLERLIFAVNTNPHLSQKQATEILQYLKPFVTVFQESSLQCDTIKESNGAAAHVYQVYKIISDAIAQGRRIQFSTQYMRYNKSTNTPEERQEYPTLFTPKCVYTCNNNEIYVIGYNHPDKRVQAVNLANITTVQIAYKYKIPNEQTIRDNLAATNNKDVIPGKYSDILYEGPIHLRFRGQYLESVLDRFGINGTFVEKSVLSYIRYTLPVRRITSDDLHWMAAIPNQGVRIEGPEPLCKAVEAYYQSLTYNLLNWRFYDIQNPQYGNRNWQSKIT